ncbi:hypothetical protein JD844_002785 [Phrynosoma platyrhinos]|uniref:acid phosphatase n=1 Tax=Phrynosoma platyrhinos TaxID=52577 RepID=A0ABQ7TCC4_PHRPL|nr:hypothetical protein JD844_002785 [Phrynosoma platyrhinos]
MGGRSLTRSTKKLYSSLLSLLFFLFHSASGRELKFVLLAYRHGDRSPIEKYPTGLHSESDWPQGFGQLTKIGIQQQYELGQYIKKRYSNFLSATYKREEKLRYPVFNCPRYLELLKETMTSREFQTKIQPYQEFIKTISFYSGYNPSTLKYLDNFKLWHIQDTLFCESIHNYTLPKWATKDVRAKLSELTVISLSALFGIYKREEKARLQGGLLVKAILENISNAAKYPDKRKMLVYSAHDTTLGALQMALNVYNEKLLPYAACQFFELYKESNGQTHSIEYTIEMHFQNDTSKDPYLLTLPGCSSACPLSQFTELVSPILVEDWESECKTEGKKGNYLDMNKEDEQPVAQMEQALGLSATS